MPQNFQELGSQPTFTDVLLAMLRAFFIFLIGVVKTETSLICCFENRTGRILKKALTTLWCMRPHADNAGRPTVWNMPASFPKFLPKKQDKPLTVKTHEHGSWIKGSETQHIIGSKILNMFRFHRTLPSRSTIILLSNFFNKSKKKNLTVL